MTFWDFADHRPFMALFLFIVSLAAVVQTVHILKTGRETGE